MDLGASRASAGVGVRRRTGGPLAARPAPELTISKFFVAAKIWFAGLLSSPAAPPPSTAAPPAAFVAPAPPVTAGAAWTPKADQSRDLRASCAGKGTASECVLSFLRNAGAPAAALDFARRLGGEGYLVRFDPHGRVGAARVSFPLRGAESVLLVNGEPAAVDVAARALLDPLQSDPRLRALKADAALWTDAPGQPGLKALRDGGQRFIMAFPVRSCETCPDLATGFVGYDFDADGRFLGAKLLAVRRPSLFAVSGEVLGGKAFEAPLGPDLRLRLEPFPEGWTITVQDKAGKDYCALVTPPFNGPNDLVIHGSQLQGGDGPGKTRNFRCARNAQNLEQARADADRFLWTSKPRSKEASAARRDHERLMEAARPGRLKITEFRLGTTAGGNAPSIESMKFDFELSPAPGEK